MASAARLPLPTAGDDPASRSALGHQPEALTAFNRLYATLWSRSRIDPAILELARLRNARVTGCGL